MKRLLLVACSPRLHDSVSRRAADLLLEQLCLRASGLEVVRRDLVRHPPRLVDAAFVTAMRVPPGAQTAAERAALAESEALIAELEATDALVITTPMHNFTVPAPLKAWIDQVLRINRTFRSTPQGKIGLLADRPAFAVIATGGAITGEAARQPDFLTPYLGAALGTLGIRRINFLYLEAGRLAVRWLAHGCDTATVGQGWRGDDAADLAAAVQRCVRDVGLGQRR